MARAGSGWSETSGCRPFIGGGEHRVVLFGCVVRILEVSLLTGSERGASGCESALPILSCQSESDRTPPADAYSTLVALRARTGHRLDLGRLARRQFPVQVQLKQMPRRRTRHTKPTFTLAATQSASR